MESGEDAALVGRLEDLWQRTVRMEETDSDTDTDTDTDTLHMEEEEDSWLQPVARVTG